MGDRIQLAAVPTDTADGGKVRSYLEKLSVRRLPVFRDPERLLAANSADDAAPLTLYAYQLSDRRLRQHCRLRPGATDWLADDAQRLLAYYISG